MTRLDHVFMLEADTILDNATLQHIADAGHSRIPVFDDMPDNILGIILVKNLILLDKRESSVRVRELELNMAKRMPQNTNLFDAINYFQEGASHLAIVTCQDGHVVGICTLEDCIEEILLEEVWDESDQYTDNTHTTRVPRIPRKSRSERKQKVNLNGIV